LKIFAQSSDGTKIRFKVTFLNGDSLVTSINGTQEEIEKYYLGNSFNLGCGEKDRMTIAIKVEFLD
jgi:hypothetical protein